ncbi:C13 family peptidase [Sphingomonas hengshuiensis]|uniref:Peptidase C13 n=1 Tax=Sphingomonas hengshuiensis TaxID=1609977 RepID=A0A7U4JBL3_9SPHN|nr:C13 family peptidase [Sphingomonas hengshuiensis]AJP73818.1 peptidase C13 [Sphingomonas hengshuiensis]
MRWRFGVRLLALAATLTALPALAQPRHTRDWPQLASGDNPSEAAESLAEGPELQRGRSARALLADQRALTRALDALLPQRKPLVDAYVVSVALDSDPVFGREAREAGKVLARRYDAAGRTIVLAGPTGPTPDDLPNGSLQSLAVALARVAEVMDKSQDVLILYATSHGAQVGIAYHDGDQGFGLLAPARLAALLDELGIRNRVLLLSACYSGIFVRPLANDTTALITAASSDRTSFGCRAENDWTFFGDALVNHALRKPQPLEAAAIDARDQISGWEMATRLTPSRPQVAIGDGVAAFLAPLEARMPTTATEPVGAPATDALKAD